MKTTEALPDGHPTSMIGRRRRRAAIALLGLGIVTTSLVAIAPASEAATPHRRVIVAQPGGSVVSGFTVSRDGTRVVYESSEAGQDSVELKDLRAGRTTTLASMTRRPTDVYGYEHSLISGDGNVVYVVSPGTEQVAGVPDDGLTRVFRLDLVSGAKTVLRTTTGEPLTVEVPHPPLEQESYQTTCMATDDTGRFLAFSPGLSPTSDDGSRDDGLYLLDTATGRYQLVNHALGSTTQAAGPADCPAISGNGRYVAYTSSPALAPADHDNASDAYVFDRNTGQNRLVSRRGGSAPVVGVTMNRAGNKVAYLTARPRRAFNDIYVGRRAKGRPTLVAKRVKTAGHHTLLMSGNGRFLTHQIAIRKGSSAWTRVVRRDLRAGRAQVIARRAEGAIPVRIAPKGRQLDWVSMPGRATSLVRWRP